METSTANYAGQPISFLELPDNGLLLRTQDVCRLLNITDRPSGTILSKPCLDLASAVNLATSVNPDFAVWLNEEFAGYRIETIVHPKCDDDWKFL